MTATRGLAPQVPVPLLTGTIPFPTWLFRLGNSIVIADPPGVIEYLNHRFTDHVV